MSVPWLGLGLLGSPCNAGPMLLLEEDSVDELDVHELALSRTHTSARRAIRRPWSRWISLHCEKSWKQVYPRLLMHFLICFAALHAFALLILYVGQRRLSFFLDQGRSLTSCGRRATCIPARAACGSTLTKSSGDARVSTFARCAVSGLRLGVSGRTVCASRTRSCVSCWNWSRRLDKPPPIARPARGTPHLRRARRDQRLGLLLILQAVRPLLSSRMGQGQR
mmetsp:Transcript_4366/g.12817  ORF Transcript_4366/g.12817 Transcript_4366/m.12817 type:complete len:223 (+) Transcript_4366:2118-2786(+)